MSDDEHPAATDISPTKGEPPAAWRSDDVAQILKGRSERNNWEARDSTAAIFGAHLSCLRHKGHNEIEIEDLAKHSGRSQRWLRAVERGEIRLGEASLVALEIGLKKADPTLEANPDANLRELYQGYANDPFASETIALVNLLPNSPEDSAASAPAIDSGKTLPVLGGLQAIDRVLVVWPAVLFVALLALLTGATLLASGQQLPSTLSWRTMIAVGVAAVSASALAVPPLGSLLKYSARHLRFGTRRKTLGVLMRLRRGSDIPVTSALDWHEPVAGPYLHPMDRTDAECAAIEVEVAERLHLVFSFGALASLLILILELSSDGLEQPRWLVSFFLVSTILATNAAWSARQAAKTVFAATFHGLGSPRI